MSGWVLKGLATGIKTTLYPKKDEKAPGISAGRPCAGKVNRNNKPNPAVCPAGALADNNGTISVDYSRCIHCFRCLRTPGIVPLNWQAGYEWATAPDRDKRDKGKMGKAFRRSLHIRIVDAGSCGACLSEISQMSKPCYNIHRLGFFITPTPRMADVLVVAGPVTDHMRFPLKEAYEAMPAPRAVVAIGTCALSGGIFGPSFASCKGVREVLPVDVAVPGCPPPPLAIIHSLLLLVGRRPSAPLVSTDDLSRGDRT